MTLENLGNLGEFIAAVAVVVSLIYLALQIRQNTRSVKDSAFQGVVHTLAELTMRLGTDLSTGKCGRYPVSDELAEWIEQHVSTEARFRGKIPLFPNPRTGRIYSRKTIQDIWRNACKDADVDHVPPYRATKHSTLSELARVLTPQQLQGLARHKKFETTRIYFGENADPKAEAQTARAELLATQNQVANKRPTKNISQLKDVT